MPTRNDRLEQLGLQYDLPSDASWLVDLNPKEVDHLILQGLSEIVAGGGGGGGGGGGDVSIQDAVVTSRKLVVDATGKIGVTGTFFQATQPVSIASSVAVTGTFWQATQPVSAASLPLPSGAATAAKQPALGTAGAASTDVLSVQGVVGGIAQPVSLAAAVSVGGQAADGATAVGNPVQVGGVDGSGNAQAFLADTGGRLTITGPQATGAALAGNPIVVAGSSGGTTAVNLAVTSGGNLRIEGQAATGGALSGVRPVTVSGVDGGGLVRTNLTDTGGASVVMPQFKATTYGTTKFRSTTVTNAAVAVKASAGNLYALSVLNRHSAAIFVKFYDTSQPGTTVGTTTPVAVFQVAANDQLHLRGADSPWFFGTAITVACVTGAADNDATAAAALPIIELETV